MLSNAESASGVNHKASPRCGVIIPHLRSGTCPGTRNPTFHMGLKSDAAMRLRWSPRSGDRR